MGAIKGGTVVMEAALMNVTDDKTSQGCYSDSRAV
jgi:hypothetical protein